MSNRNEIIEGLEHVVEVFDGRITGPWYEGWMRLTKDALALLKAQEPIKPQVKFNHAGQPMWACGNCGTTLFFRFPRQTDDEDQRSIYGFCNYCGRKVKWE